VPYRSYVLSHLGQDDFTIEDARLNYSWDHSERSPNGGLLLRDNGLTYEEWKVLRWEPNGAQAAQFLPNAADPNLCWRWGDIPSATRRLEAQTYARLRGKLYKGSAALGVTLASWRQSQEMITTRYRQIGWGLDTMSRSIQELQRTARRGQYERLAKRLAGAHLEVIFGWQPLIQDIHAAATTVIHDQPQVQRVTARASAPVDLRETWGDQAMRRHTGLVMDI